jgi:hypothetical protein
MVFKALWNESRTFVELRRIVEERARMLLNHHRDGVEGCRASEDDSRNEK